MLEQTLQDFLGIHVFAFALTFVRLGTAIMIMPGIGDSFVSARVRLHFAVALTLALFPLTVQYIPDPLPATFGLFALILMEFIIGIFFGGIARIFMMALDTAGMVISISSGLSNAQLFNPALSTQGSLVGAFLSITGVVVLFSLNLHHLLFAGIIESYEFFPMGAIPDWGSMAEMVARAVSAAFSIGIKIAAPFLVMSILIYTGMGVLSRLMPQVQVFLIALPLQILIALALMTMFLSSAYLYWGTQFEQAMVFFLKSSGG
ncbi:MAG: flagellar biosynthetic protein FliR [Bdellovibrionales bacterium]